MRDAIQAALKDAQKSQDNYRVCTLRLISAAVKDRRFCSQCFTSAWQEGERQSGLESDLEAGFLFSTFSGFTGIPAMS